MLHRAGSRRFQAMAVAVTLVPALGGLQGSAAGSSPPLPAHPALAPPLPAQPGAPDAGCTPLADPPGMWRQVYQEVTAVNPPAYQIAVDPWQPCSMFRAGDDHSLSRSSDSGATWQPVFSDAETNAAGSRFAATDLHVAQKGQLVMSEDGNGDALVRSDGAGTGWRLADAGIEGLPVTQVDVAPSDGGVMYAATDGGTKSALQTASLGLLQTASLGLVVSVDGGMSWRAATVPGGLPRSGPENTRDPLLAIDPANAAHVWMLVTYVTTAQSQLIESSDYGQDWSSPVPVPEAPTQFFATRTPSHGLTLFMNDSNGLTAPAMESVDDGATWAPLPVTPVPYGFLGAQTPTSDTMVYVGYTANWSMALPTGDAIGGQVTDDGWKTSRALPAYHLPRYPEQWPQTPLRPGTIGPYTTDGTIDLQSDRRGDFYLLVASSCVEQSLPPGQHCYRGEPGGGSTYYSQTLLEITPPPPPTTGTRTAGGGSSTSSGPPAGPPPPQGYRPPPSLVPSQMQVLRTCPLTAAANTTDQSGALASDGQALLYTSYPDPGVAAFRGLVHRLDPITCAALPPLLVSFTAQDLQRVALTDNFPAEATFPYIDTLTYDPNADTYWLSLRTAASPYGNNWDSLPTSVFSATVTRGLNGQASALATFRYFTTDAFNVGNGASLFTYDFTDDTIWASSTGSSTLPPSTLPMPGEDCSFAAWGGGCVGLPGHIQASTGAQLPSCWPYAAGNDYAGFPPYIATWVLGAPGRLYVQSEDDQTVWEVDDQTCAILHTFAHRTFGEPLGEDEQMACDSLNFALGSAYADAANSPTSAIWLRDAVNDEVVAYGIPDGRCPYPTTTRYLGVSSTSRGGTQLCARLTRRGIAQPIADRPMHFTLASVNLGAGTTDAQGIACVPDAVAVAGGPYAVKASFLGDDSYGPSSDGGTLGGSTAHPPITLLAGSIGVAPTGPVSANLPQAQPASSSALQAAPEAQAQAQVQAQSQAQAQTQSVAQAQPGVMVQRRTRTQVAIQEKARGTNTAYEATALRPARQTPLAAVVLGGALLGIGLLRRRPRRAPARAVRDLRHY